MGQRIYIFNKFQVMMEVLLQGPHFENFHSRRMGKWILILVLGANYLSELKQAMSFPVTQW